MDRLKLYALITITMLLLAGCATTAPGIDILRQAETAEAPRSNNRKGLYVCTTTTGGGAGALDALDITASGSPNTYDLITGDLAIVANSGGWDFYVFDAVDTNAEDDPNHIRPDDYSTSGVWDMDENIGQGIRILSAEPDDEYIGEIIIVIDPAAWNPANVSGTDPYLAICTGPNTWAAWLSATGDLLISGIDTPPLRSADLTDTSSPHDLTADDLMNKSITNAGSAGSEVYNMPIYTNGAGWNVTFVVESANSMTIEVPGEDGYIVNGVQGTPGQNISNPGTIGETLTCIFFYQTVICKGDSGWGFP